ncbi:type IX secretion system anionic LPS delivery protein PorZ [Coprobacter sp.]
MIKKLFIFLHILFYSFSASAQTEVGAWKIYPVFLTPSQITETKEKVYFLSDGYLFSYGKEDEEFRELNRLNILSDNDIKLIKYNNEHNILVVTYTNSNIDLIIGESVYNIPYIKNTTITSSKNINDITFYNDEIYLSTDFGIVILNIPKKEIKTTYYFNKIINSATVMGDYFYCTVQDDGLYRCKLNDVLYDFKNWTKHYSTGGTQLLALENGMWMLDNNKNIIYFDTEDNNTSIYNKGDIYSIKKTSSGYMACGTNGIIIYDKNNQKTDEIIYSDYEGTMSDIVPVDISINNKQNIYWILYNKGIAAFKRSNESFQQSTNIDNLNYSTVNTPYFLTMTNNGKLYVSTQGVSSKNIYDQYVESHISIYENNKWNNTNLNDIPTYFHPDTKFCSTYNIAEDPEDPETFYIGTWFEGLYRFKNNKYDTHWNGAEDNSPIFGGWSHKVNCLNFDSDKNLWMINFSTPGILVMKKDGSWIKLNYPDIITQQYTEQIILCKHTSSKWVIIPKTSFVFAFNTNNTLENMSDDQTRKFSTFSDQDNKQIDGTDFLCAAEDRKGQLWIGTNRGPIVLTNPDNFMRSDFRCTRIKIPRNDGTNAADLLLNDENIQFIAVDGANRKWIATQSSGVYLVSEDGLETIHHFNMDNSILPSNNVLSIAINHITGEVFFGTEKGLVSYRSDATEPKEDFSNVYAFPNPVRPDYTGVITITGLQEKSLVKITDTTGNLIYQNYSEGGQMVWNGLNRNGDRVKTGVYLVFASSSNGKEGVVTKILIVN